MKTETIIPIRIEAETEEAGEPAETEEPEDPADLAVPAEGKVEEEEEKTNAVRPINNLVQITEMTEDEPARQPWPSNKVYNVPIAIIEEDIDEVSEEENDLNIEDAIITEDNIQDLWKCRACTLLNPIVTKECEVCGLIRKEDEEKTEQNQTYLQLVNLDNEDLVKNVEMFECLVCLADCPPGEGVTLRECLHQFCRYFFLSVPKNSKTRCLNLPGNV